jgi:hypothetical protein
VQTGQVAIFCDSVGVVLPRTDQLGRLGLECSTVLICPDTPIHLLSPPHARDSRSGDRMSGVRESHAPAADRLELTPENTSDAGARCERRIPSRVREAQNVERSYGGEWALPGSFLSSFLVERLETFFAR